MVKFYIIVVYDITEEHNHKVFKVLKKYLFRFQNSVFEGELTPSKYKQLLNELNSIIDTHSDDKILIYKLLSKKYLYVDILGSQTRKEAIII